MRGTSFVILFAALAACAPAVPNSGADYFDNTEDARRARDIALNGGPTPPSAVPSATVLPGPSPQSQQILPPVQTTPANVATASSDDIAADTQAALDATLQDSGQAPVQASPANPAPPLQNNPTISDEQDFAAVSNRESIQSDAARIARNSQEYQQIDPTALPNRPSSAQPNIVAYALSTSHPRGTRLHSRSGINLAARAQRACAGYASADLAQIAFLERGGPERDRLGLDPDGDGYACQWNPAPFRQASN